MALPLSAGTVYASPKSGNIQTFDSVTGALLNSTFITGDTPSDLFVAGNILYEANFGNSQNSHSGSVREYDATTGALILGNVASVSGQDSAHGSG